MALDAATLLEYGLEATDNSYRLACCGVQGPLTMREWRLIQALHHIARGTGAARMRDEAIQALVQWQATLAEGETVSEVS